jgi:hypothetical protein
VSIRTACTAPLQRVANVTSIASRNVTVQVDPPSSGECAGTSHYVLFGEGADASTPPSILDASRSNDGIITSLSPARVYWVMVAGEGPTGTLTYGTWLSVETISEPPAFVTAPTLRSIPGGFTITWPPVPADTGAIIRYALTQGPNATEVYETTAGVRYAEVSGLTAGNYTFAIVACTSGGCTSSSSVGGTVALQPPIAVGVPSVSAVGARSATVDWIAATSGDAPVVYSIELQQCVYFAVVNGTCVCMPLC